MFSLRIVTFLFAFAFAGSNAFQTIVKPESFLDMETDQKSSFKSSDHDKMKILFKNDGQIDLMLPFQRANHLEDEEAPLLMKRGKGKGWKRGGHWKGRGGYGKKWKYRGGGYGGPGGYNGGGYGNYGPNGPGDW